MTLSLDDRVEHLLLHYDYERDKGGGYPEAHLQVCATSPDWEQLRRRQDDVHRPLAKLHLPVGGRRFRPTPEDLVEFLIAEDLAEGRDGRREIIENSRARFREKQLRAAIRRYPEIALDCLRAEGHLS